MSTPPQPSSDTEDLLSADRELSEAERARLEMLGTTGWAQVQFLLTQRSRATYGQAPADVFQRCVMYHLDTGQREEMMTSEIYACPRCATVLKDRRTLAASSVLLERARLARMWLEVERAPVGQYETRLERFRRALGLA